MEFNRRVIHGELSEVFGPATLDTDKLLRTLGIAQAAKWQWQGLPAYFSPSWTSFQAERGCDFSVIVDGISN